MSTSPAAAACSSRAAVFTTSPVASDLTGGRIAGDHLAGVDPGADRKLHPPSLARCRGSGSSRADCMSKAARTARRASSSWICGMPKTAITASPMNFSTVPSWRSIATAHRVEVALHHLAQRLGVELLADRRGAGDIGEQDRHPPARLVRTLAGALGGDRRPAVQAEARSLRVGLAAARAGQHGRSVRFRPGRDVRRSVADNPPPEGKRHPSLA